VAHRAAGKNISASERELYWATKNGRGRCELLDELVQTAKRCAWPGDFHGGWSTWDIELMADVWHHVTIRTATEELGWPKRFTRARWGTKSTRMAQAAVTAVGAWCITAFSSGAMSGLLIGLAAALLLLLKIVRSRRRCMDAVGELIWHSAHSSGLADDAAVKASASKTRQGVMARQRGPRSRTSRYSAFPWHAARAFEHAPDGAEHQLNDL
jgi:hypothetical protein